MFAAASGMAAEQQNLDVIASNLANADVVGFKSAIATFAPVGPNAQFGTTSAGVRALFTQGKLEKSGGPFDVAIDGAGFFTVERDGVRGYTRAGAFARLADGSLRNPDGWRLCGVRIPANAQTVGVEADGTVRVTGAQSAAGAPDVPQPVGRIALVGFSSPEALRLVDASVFVETRGSGSARPSAAGGEHQPKIAFGMLEKSNVSIVESMMAILAAQRAYEANAKGVQAADEMLRIANNLHRS